MSNEQSLRLNEIGIATITVSWGLTVTAVLAFVLHLYSRRISHAKLRLDDLFIFLALVCSIAFVVLTTWAVVDEGQGSHMDVESRSHFENVAKSLLANEVIWGTTSTLIRIAAVLYIQKLFGVMRYFRCITAALLALSLGYGVAVVSIPLTICRPMQASWDQSIPGQCGSETAAFLWIEVVGLAIDLAILASPIVPITRLQISALKKFYISAILSVGGFVLIITALRIAALNRVNSTDFTYDKGYLGLLSIIGTLVSIILCCVTNIFGPSCQRKVQQRLRSQYSVYARYSLLPSFEDSVEEIPGGSRYP